MARSPDLPLETLSAAQKSVHDEIMSRIGGRAVRGPFAVMLNAPAVADGAIRTYSAFRASKLERRLFELMILVVARHCRAHYEWFAHAPRALDAGIAPETIEAIRTWRVPVLTRDDDKLVYDIVTELSTTRRLSQASYDRAQAALGVERLVELVAGAGFYTMIAMTINAFDVSPPDGTRPLQE